jgi:2,3-dihydroxybenzoate decarboxylase
LHQAVNYTLPDDKDYPEEWRLASRLLDVHGPTRLGEMYHRMFGTTSDLRDTHGVGMMVLSITSPGCQGEADREKSEALAKRANNYMADIVSKNPTRFQGFASVSMHNPAEAAQELTRAVKELGLKGCMLNDCTTCMTSFAYSDRAIQRT